MKLTWSARIARDLMYLFRVFPIDKKKIVFCSFFGKKYDDNPREISEAMTAYKDVKKVWILDEGVSHPETIRTVRPKSMRSLFELATAKVWVDNSRKLTFVRKRKGQFYVQTWHGGIALKKIEGDAINGLKEQYIYAAKNDSRMADLFLSECEWRTRNYRTAFWYNGEILKSGLPKSEIFYQDRSIIRNKVHERLKIDQRVQIALYAPTFRSNLSIDAYSLDYEGLLKTLKQRFGGEWCVIVRLHPHLSKQADFMTYNEKIIQGTDYPDVYELLLASKVLISDYSGCIFDGIRAGLKVFLFATDLEEYLKKERQLYFSFEELPVTLAQNNSQLFDQIKAFDEEKMMQKRKEFLDNMGYYSSEHATQTIVYRILSEMEK